MKNYSEGTHHAIRDYSYGMIMDGVARKTVIETIKGIMYERRNDSKRNEERFADIERIVRGASSGSGNSNGGQLFNEDESSEQGFGDDNERSKTSDQNLDWPPGLMGELSKSVYEFSPYPNRVISIVTALGLVAGIAGRRFNISGNGLNLYITLLMDTGGGKSVISKYITRVLNDSSILVGGDAFTGSGRYTGPKALMDDLDCKRCMVSVFTEAGFMFKSKSGDQDGLTRSILDLYGSSGYGCVSAGGNYSNDKNNIKAVASPCFSMINESTPDIFLETIRNGDRTGEINRMTVLRVEQESTTLNRDMKYEVGEELKSKIKLLMGRCYATQSKDNADVTNFRVTDEMYAFADKMKAEAMNYREDDYTRFSMLQRSAEKMFKVSALLSLFNTTGSKGTRELDLDAESINWALKLHDYEMLGLQDFFELSDENDPFELACMYIYPVVKKILKCEYKDRQMQPNAVMRKKNIFPLSMLRRGVKNNKQVKALGNNSISGIDRMIKWLKDEKYIKIIKVNTVGGVLVKVYDSFLGLGDHYRRK